MRNSVVLRYGNTACPYLGRILHVGADAGAGIIVPFFPKTRLRRDNPTQSLVNQAQSIHHLYPALLA